MNIPETSKISSCVVQTEQFLSVGPREQNLKLCLTLGYDRLFPLAVTKGNTYNSFCTDIGFPRQSGQRFLYNS